MTFSMYCVWESVYLCTQPQLWECVCVCFSSVTFSTLSVLTVQSGRTSSDTLEMRMSLNTVIGLLSSGQYLWHRIWNVTQHTHTYTCVRSSWHIDPFWWQGCEPKLSTACPSECSYLWRIITVNALTTYSAFFVTLRKHGDGMSSCLPDHPPKIGHCARQWTLRGYELIRTQVSLKTEKQSEAFICFNCDMRVPQLHNSNDNVSRFAGTHWDKAGVDVVWPCSARFWQQFHSIVIV